MSVTTKNPSCKVSLRLLCDYWIMIIVDMLSDGPRRFRSLEQSIGDINTATLTTRLKCMVAAGLVQRNEQSRADVTYELTDLGKQAIQVIHAVNKFSNYAETSPKK